MASIIYNQLDQLIYDQAEQTYNDWISADLEEIEDNHHNFKKQFQRQRLDLDQVQNQLRRKLNQISTLSRTEVNSELNQTNRLFNELQTAQNKLSNTLQYQRRNMTQLCDETQENLAEYLPEVDSIEVYEDFINQPTIEVTLPVIGSVQMTPQEMQSRIESRGQDLLEVIEERIDNFDYTDFIQRTQRLIEECQEHIQHIAQRQKNLTEAQEEYMAQIGPLAADAIAHLSDLNMRQSSELTQFAQNLQEVLGLQVDIEVSAPETNQDAILAELLQTCDQPNSQDKLIQLGMQLDYDFRDLQNKSSAELCQMLTQYFAL